MKLSDFTETVLLVVIGIVLHVLDMKELANVSFLLGPALSAQRKLITQRLKAEVEPVHKLAEVMDLTPTMRPTQFSELLNAYLQITEDEFKGLKDQTVQHTLRSLDRLGRSKQSEPLTMGAYYAWLLPMLQGVREGTRVWAVSTMMDSEWDDSPQEEEFLRLNLEIPGKGAQLERIFIIPDEILEDLPSNRGVAAHLENLGPQLKAWIVSRDKLEANDPELLRDVRDGWIAFDNRVVLIDETTSAGARGFVSMAEAELGRLARMFEQLRVQGRPIEKALPSSSKKLLTEGGTESGE